MFSIDAMKILEIVGRVSLIWVSCLVLLRVSGRREMSELGPMDLLTMLLLSEAVSPALTVGDETITGGLVAAVVLLGFGVLTSWLSVRSKKLDALLQGTAKVLIHNGRVNAQLLRKQRITDEDLRAKLHEHGLMTVHDVARAYVEADGNITIIKKTDLEESRERNHAA
jgi:uncharacterized membrane protein YcaP (DUF421 family)